jgi:DNA polymerase III alpha subunit
MIKDKFGQQVYSENDIFSNIMQGIDGNNFLVNDIDVVAINAIAETELVNQYIEPQISIEEYDNQNQANWYMPNEYKELDIAEYVLSLCNTQEELQRCGEELLMYQDRNLFDLLKYLRYLVDTMKENNVIWGVGRGSSVSSYVLYKLGIHRIDSMYYNLEVGEFLR